MHPKNNKIYRTDLLSITTQLCNIGGQLFDILTCMRSANVVNCFFFARPDLPRPKIATPSERVEAILGAYFLKKKNFFLAWLSLGRAQSCWMPIGRICAIYSHAPTAPLITDTHLKVNSDRKSPTFIYICEFSLIGENQHCLSLNPIIFFLSGTGNSRRSF